MQALSRRLLRLPKAQPNRAAGTTSALALSRRLPEAQPNRDTGTASVLALFRRLPEAHPVV
jgi:hypothetical protein